MRTSLIAIFVFSLIALPVMGQANVRIDIEVDDPFIVMINYPDGTGTSFDDCLSGAGPGGSTRIDNTIKMTVTAYDSGEPITHLDPELCYLELYHEQAPHIKICGGNSPSLQRIAYYGCFENYDSPTGEYYIKCSLPCGGFSSTEYRVSPVIFVDGWEATAPACWVTMRSSDMNGDLVVNVADVGEFTHGYFNSHAKSDMNGDGLYNLADVSFFATGIGKTCN